MAFLTDLLKQVFTTTATGAVAFRAIISGDQTIADVTVTGTLDVTGASTVTDLTVSGTLTANDIATPQVPTNIANVGSVAVISDVQSSILYNKLGGKILDKNVLLRTGDLQAFAATTPIALGDPNALAVGGFALVRVEVTANSLNAGTFKPVAGGATATLPATTSLDFAFGAANIGVKYAIVEVAAIGTNELNLVDDVTAASGAVTFSIAVFSLSALGTYTSDHVLALASLGVTVTTAASWSGLGTATGYATTVPPILAPSHVSSMEGAIVEEVVNYGGNLAYNDEVYGYRSIKTDDTDKIAKTENGLIVTTSGIVASNNLGYFVEIQPNTQYTVSYGSINDGSMEIYEYAEKSKSVNTSAALASAAVTLSQTFTSTSTTRYLFISWFGMTAVGATLTNIQLNAGSTASTYSEPRSLQIYSPFIMGQKSDQLLKDGAGEMGASRWTGAVLTGADLIVSLAATPAVTPFTARQSGIHTFAVKNTTADAATVTGDLNSVTSGAVAGTGTPPWSVSTVELVAGKTYDFTVTASVNTTKIQAMIILGEYTQAQIESRGYEAYDGIDLLTCPNNAGTSTVSDTLEQDAQGRIMFTPYVQRNAGYLGYGSPELDTTEIVTNGDFVADTDWSKTGSVTIAGTCTFASGSSSSIYQTIASPPLGQMILLEFDVVSNAGTKAIFTVTQGARSGSIFSTATAQAAVGTVAGKYTYRIPADGSAARNIIGLQTNTTLDGDIVIDNFSAKLVNIQENLAPEPVDYTPYVIKGNLNQLAEVGQNHQVSSDGMLVYTTHYLGLGASLENIKSVIVEDITQYTTDKDGNVVEVVPEPMEADK
jgi:hypothetical protein